MLLINGRRVLGAALLAALLAALVAGCGGSSDAAPLKKPQFVKQANAICVEAQQERAAVSKELSKQGGGSGGSAEAEEVMTELLEPIEGMTERLSELAPPKGQEREVEAIVAAYEKGTSQLQGGPEGKTAVTAFDEADQLALAYGLTECTI